MNEPLTVEWESGPARDKLWQCGHKHIVASFHKPEVCSVCTKNEAEIASAVAGKQKLLQEAHDEMDRANEEYGGALNVKSIPNCFWCAAPDYDEVIIHDVGCIINRLEAGHVG